MIKINDSVHYKKDDYKILIGSIRWYQDSMAGRYSIDGRNNPPVMLIHHNGYYNTLKENLYYVECGG